MVEALPAHDHCEVCDDPVDAGERFCSELCKDKYEKDLRKERNKNLYFFAGIIVLFIAMTLVYLIFGQ